MSAAIKPRRELSLYERAQVLATIDARIDAYAIEHPGDAGVVPDDLAAAWAAALLGFENAGEAQAEYIKSLELSAANCDAEIERLSALRGIYLARAERKAAWMQAWMQERGLTAIKSDLFKKIEIVENPPHAVIAEGLTPEQVPERFTRLTPPKPAVLAFDKTAILAAAKAGEVLPNGLSVARDTKLVIK